MTCWSNVLRAELCTRASRFAESAGVEFYTSRGSQAVVLFPRSADGTRHGNLHPESFAAIVSHSTWEARLRKLHPQREKALPAPHHTTACELDSCTSSDALLMNVMCYPGAITGDIAALLGVDDGVQPEFGVPGEVSLSNGSSDRTELDMLLGSTIVEAKLTETSFTAKSVASVERYTGLYDVFEKAALPLAGVGDDEEPAYLSYQLIRNVLAVAGRPSAKLRVLLDARRPDLLREWWVLHSAIRHTDLRRRCGFVFWQELAAAAPTPLREFLNLKYGV